MKEKGCKTLKRSSLSSSNQLKGVSGILVAQLCWEITYNEFVKYEINNRKWHGLLLTSPLCGQGHRSAGPSVHSSTAVTCYAGLSFPSGDYGAFWERRCWPLRAQDPEHSDGRAKQVSSKCTFNADTHKEII